MKNAHTHINKAKMCTYECNRIEWNAVFSGFLNRCVLHESFRGSCIKSCILGRQKHFTQTKLLFERILHSLKLTCAYGGHGGEVKVIAVQIFWPVRCLGRELIAYYHPSVYCKRFVRLHNLHCVAISLIRSLFHDCSRDNFSRRSVFRFFLST